MCVRACVRAGISLRGEQPRWLKPQGLKLSVDLSKVFFATTIGYRTRSITRLHGGGCERYRCHRLVIAGYRVRVPGSLISSLLSFRRRDARTVLGATTALRFAAHKRGISKWENFLIRRRRREEIARSLSLSRVADAHHHPANARASPVRWKGEKRQLISLRIVLVSGADCIFLPFLRQKMAATAAYYKS